MRLAATTVCALTLAGCASSLPYSIAIGDPRENTGRAGREQCVLRLDDVVATVVEVDRKPSSRHHTPMRLSFTDRLVFDAYIRNEFSTAFNENLERPDDPHSTDRPHAFPWER